MGLADPETRCTSCGLSAVAAAAACLRLTTLDRPGGASRSLWPACSTVAKVVGAKAAPAVVTLSFIAFWYALNIAFNLQVGAGQPQSVAAAAARCLLSGGVLLQALPLLGLPVAGCAQLVLMAGGRSQQSVVWLTCAAAQQGRHCH